MNTKVLVGGSITATVMIVFASFTSVVGYSSVNDTEVVDSPLFNIRSQKILGSDSLKINREYLGNEKESIISFPKKTANNSEIPQLMNWIRTMDTVAFNQFITRFKMGLYNGAEDFSDNQIHKIISVIHFIRNNGHAIVVYGKDDEHDPPTWMCYTHFFGCWVLAIIITVLTLLLNFIDDILDSILTLDCLY